MTNSSDTNENTNSSSDEYWTSLIKFIQTIISIILVVTIYYFGSGFVLFICKVNNFPTNFSRADTERTCLISFGGN
jgi:hypothetical protein